MDFENATGPGLDAVSGQAETSGATNLVNIIWGVNLTAFVLVGLTVPLRVIVRCTVTRDFFSDDVLVIIAALFTFGICSLLPLATDLGLGQHSSDIDSSVLVDDTKNLLQLLFIANILYPCAVAFARLSIVCSFLRLLTDRNARWVLFATAALTGAFALASVFAVIFQCNPISAAWDPTVSGASCYPFLSFLQASTAINIAIDALLCTMPLAYIWGMKLPLSQKIRVTVLFTFASLSCAAVITKMSYLQLLSQADLPYHWTSWVLCSIAECTVGIETSSTEKRNVGPVRILQKKNSPKPCSRIPCHQADGDPVARSAARDHEESRFQV
ncbi:uncharacterized protein GLRG_08539 [Colletotrichum graminicola M1.001]|uniref:Rhodopsin domain-containing protein n=1 Tax=Colletotrichum graminicola (strain M1.001 / M2 / FGSC 10212) TaxID=645133 RepID=E3QRX2_COLGM|nr:uncharacterized protein GLRG_08539 [Colletotrichum graminicola M1.001]EFQ33610.1 hypothetical protein GLRG_08539 [Colletotrichum graminicola M1.001]